MENIQEAQTIRWLKFSASNCKAEGSENHRCSESLEIQTLKSTILKLFQ